jgi:hypothetical protein
MKRRNRRGAILVLAAFMMVVVLSVLVVVVDFSRIYVQKNELQTAADAAALAGVMELAEGAPSTMVKDSAITYGQKNKAVGQAITISPTDITCGIWDDPSSSYSDDSGTCTAAHNSVTVTTKAMSTNSLAGILSGVWQIKATARAWAAYVGATKCIKPWAIPYTKLTKTLQPLNNDTLRNLTEEDARILRTMNQTERTFMLKIGTPPNSGNFGSLEIPTGDPDLDGNGAQLYRYNIEQCNATLIGPGDTINTQVGQMTGPTNLGVEQFCEDNGSFDKPSGNCYDENGAAGIVVKAALWSQGTTKDDGKYAVIVRQIVSFVLVNLSNQVEITGYFLPYLTVGEIVATPTSLQRPILVK